MYRGESGIGKTRVFRLPRETATKRGVSVYEVCFRDVEGIPFKPFLETIRGILSDHDRGAALQEKYRYGLERLLPDLYLEAGEPGGDDSNRGSSDEASSSPAPIMEAGTACSTAASCTRPSTT